MQHRTKRHTRGIALVGAVTLAMTVVLSLSPAAQADNGRQTTTLLTPSGHQVGGMWQRWMNQSHMPTYAGSMVLDLAANSSDCGSNGAGTISACTSGTALTPEAPQLQGMPETVINIGAFMGESRTGFLRDSRWNLLYEQAHVVDQFALTDAERSLFAAMWGRPVPANIPIDQWWWQGEQSDAYGTLGEWFAYDYMICAVWPKLTWAILDYNAYNVPNWEPVSLTPLHLFPTLTDSRDEGGLVANGKYKGTIVYPPTRHESKILVQQRQSCGIISSWIAAKQAA